MVAGRQYIRPILCGALDIICLATKTCFHVSTARCGIGVAAFLKVCILNICQNNQQQNAKEAEKRIPAFFSSQTFSSQFLGGI